MKSKSSSIVFRRYENFINRIAWDIQKKCPDVPFEELRAEGCLLLCSKLPKWDPSKGALSTFLYHQISGGLKDYVKKWNRITTFDISVETEYSALFSFSPTSPEKTFQFKEAVNTLSEEGKTIVDLVTELIETSHVYFTASSFTSKEVRGKLYRKLKKQGWSWPRIWEGFKEVRLMLAEM